MSHFTVLVIGQDPERQLAPFHEFECTGTVDQYVVNVDLLDEAREMYESRTSDMVKVPAGTVLAEGIEAVSHPEHGTLVSKWANCFWSQEPANLLSQPVLTLPEGYSEIRVPSKEIETFEQFIQGYYERPLLATGHEPDIHGEHKWGWYRLNDANEVCELVRRTNPNKKWDWYVLGGRWTGFFKMKPGVSGIQGLPGLMTTPAEHGTADSAFKSDIDFDSMRREAEAEAATKYDEVRAIIEPHLPFTPWHEVRDKYIGDAPELEGGIQAAREAYHSQPAKQALNQSDDFHWHDVEDYLIDRATYIHRAGIQSSMTFAVLKDGEWYERGQMGWFGMVADEKDEGVWVEEFGKLIESLPDDTLLSVYDCHI